ncbi:unnamed protein product, partial [Meganyctiphanes norvegica]
MTTTTYINKDFLLEIKRQYYLKRALLSAMTMIEVVSTVISYIIQSVRTDMFSKWKKILTYRDTDEITSVEHYWMDGFCSRDKCSGPTQAMILANEDAIQRWRALMGPTKVYKTQYEARGTLRGQFGLSDTRNSTHGSVCITV